MRLKTQKLLVGIIIFVFLVGFILIGFESTETIGIILFLISLFSLLWLVSDYKKYDKKQPQKNNNLSRNIENAEEYNIKKVKGSKLEEKIFAFSIFGWYFIPIVIIIFIILFSFNELVAILFGTIYVILLFATGIKSSSDEKISFTKSFLFALLWIVIVFILYYFTQ